MCINCKMAYFEKIQKGGPFSITILRNTRKKTIGNHVKKIMKKCKNTQISAHLRSDPNDINGISGVPTLGTHMLRTTI